MEQKAKGEWEGENLRTDYFRIFTLIGIKNILNEILRDSCTPVWSKHEHTHTILRSCRVILLFYILRWPPDYFAVSDFHVGVNIIIKS